MKYYYGSRISDNMVQTPEDFLVCYNVPIARTGIQQYLGKELGFDGSEANDIIEVYRTESEVFNPKAMASFEGKPFTDEHPDEDVNPTNYVEYGKGTITNVRRGKGNESNMLLADIIVYSKRQIDEIRNKQKREISCGYECEYIPYKDGYMQKNIVGNHVALVTAGRAGSKVAIKDTKLNNKGGNSEMGDENRKKYRIPRKRLFENSTSNYLKAVGLKVVAQDAEPEDILEAVNDLACEQMQDENNYKALQNEEVKGAFDSNTPPTEHPTSDEDGAEEEKEEVKKTLTEIKDTLAALIKDEEIKEPENGEEVFDEIPEGMESLDDLEEELITGGDMGDDEFKEEEEIVSVEEPPEDIPLEDEFPNGLPSVNDSALDLIRAIKPIIASVPDKKARKQMSDNLSSVLKKQISNKNKMKDDSDNVYGRIAKSRSNKNKDSRNNIDEKDYGKLIAQMYNPHYKKEGK